MAVPVKKMSPMRQRHRRNAPSKRLGLMKNGACPQCGETVIPHRVCMGCGYYSGKKVVEVGIS